MARLRHDAATLEMVLFASPSESLVLIHYRTDATSQDKTEYILGIEKIPNPITFSIADHAFKKKNSGSKAIFLAVLPELLVFLTD